MVDHQLEHCLAGPNILGLPLHSLPPQPLGRCRVAGGNRDGGDRRQHVHGVFVGESHRLLLEFRKLLVACFGIAIGDHLRSDGEHGGRCCHVGRHAIEHRGGLVGAGTPKDERRQSGPDLRPAVVSRRLLEDFPGGLDLSLADQHVGPEQGQLRWCHGG